MPSPKAKRWASCGTCRLTRQRVILLCNGMMMIGITLGGWSCKWRHDLYYFHFRAYFHFSFLRSMLIIEARSICSIWKMDTRVVHTPPLGFRISYSYLRILAPQHRRHCSHPLPQVQAQWFRRALLAPAPAMSVVSGSHSSTSLTCRIGFSRLITHSPLARATCGQVPCFVPRSSFFLNFVGAWFAPLAGFPRGFDSKWWR
jgi:hypothetical protein